MTTPIEDIQALLKQIKQYGIQISTLTDLQDAATARVSKHIEELDLSSSRLIPIMQTQGTETKRSPLYIWENIGEGG
jgi:hypothetical protein